MPANLGGYRTELTRLCHLFGNEPDLQMHVQNLESLPLKNWNPKLLILDDFRQRDDLVANVFEKKQDIGSR